MIDRKDIEVGQIVEVYYKDLDITLDAKVLEIDEDGTAVYLLYEPEDVIIDPNYEVRLKK
jgi:hypothetical protein